MKKGSQENVASSQQKLLELGAQFRAKEEWDYALNAYRKALEITNQQTSDAALIYHSIGLTLLRKGNFAEAEVELLKAKDLKERFSPNELTAANTYCLLGESCCKQDKLDLALEYQKKALGIRGKLASNSPSYADSCFEMGEIFSRKSDLGESLKWYKKSIDIFREKQPYNPLIEVIDKKILQIALTKDVKEKVGARLVTISQNEEGVIHTDDKNYEGLLTHGLQTCLAVVISDKDKGVHVLQHHDGFTDSSCIMKAIAREEMLNPEVKIFCNFNKKFEHSESKDIHDAIVDVLNKNKIKHDPKLLPIASSDNLFGGVVLFKDGSVDESYFLLPMQNVESKAL